MKISEHFTLEELSFSEAASRLGLDNTPIPIVVTPAEVTLAILKSDIEYDQLILEYGWVHIGLAQEGLLSRQEALTKRSPGAAYELGIRA